jgi:APA family basic amino acid/polyamine antiporter
LIVVFIAGAAAFGHGSRANLAAVVGPDGAGAAATAGAVGSPVTAGALALGLVYVSYAYFGWNSAAYVAGEIRDPARALPRALVAGAGLVTVLYVALNLVFLWAVPPAALAGQIEVAHVVAGALFGPRGATLLSSLVALALAGSVSAFMMSGPRITVAMAEDGLFFRALGRTGPRGAPTGAVALQGALAFVAAATATFEPILIYVGFTLTISAGATVLAAFVLRHREPAAPRPHRALGWPLSGLLFLASAVFMTWFAIHDRPRESGAGLLTLLLGGAAYVLWRPRR